MTLEQKLLKCVSQKNGMIDLRKLLETFSIDFDNLALSDVRYIRSELNEVEDMFEKADQVKGYKTNNLCSIGFNDSVYFYEDELPIIQALVKDKVDKGNFNFEVKMINIKKPVLDGHIKDRKEWEEI